MAISDVQQALLNVGSISKSDFATVDFDGVSTVTDQGIWYGSRSFNAYDGIEFQAVAGDTTGTLINFAPVPSNGNPPTFVTGTIVAYDANYVVISAVNLYYMVATNGLSANDGSLFPITDFGTTGATYNPPPPVCFVEGTRIRTDRGEVKVEDLAPGDQVQVIDEGTLSSRPVIWIGYRDVNLAAYSDPCEVQPIRIRRDALGDGMPCRDLLVSPPHGVFTDGKLIPARMLVNGASIVRETRLAKFRYYHVELERHSILFSEGLTSESYLDTGNRRFFQNGGGVIDLNVGFAGTRVSAGRDTRSCAPFVDDAGSVMAVWERLLARAERLGYAAARTATTGDPAPRLVVDGREFRPVRAIDGHYTFMLPSKPREARLLTRAVRLCDTRPWIEERRVLGVSVSRVRLHHGFEIEDLALDGPAFGRGWWDVERDGHRTWRWTNGDAVVRLPEARGSSRVLEITIGGGMTYPLESVDPDFDIARIMKSA